jgi:4-amino-4-deoxy-L-arabinose transferase-like glycosyltransferase
VDRPLTRFALALLAILAIVVAFDNLQRPLANPDEGRYSEISREMKASGDWITPRLNGIKYFEKPPLQYWASALALKLFGESEITARLYVALCGLLTLAIVGYTGARLATSEAGVLSAIALLSSPYFVALGGIVTLDMGLTLWTTVALCAFLIAEGAAEDADARRSWMLVAWAGAAFAVLSKGLVGAVFPAAAFVLYWMVSRDRKALRRLHWKPGLAVFLAITAPWFVAVSLANPEFARFFFVHEHFERFLTTTHHRVAPPWYFLPIVFVGFLPWMFALPAAALHALRSERPSGEFLASFRPLTFALIWAVFVVGFFSLSSSKLPGYILPAFPALALVLGRYLADALPGRLAAWVWPIVPVSLGLAWLVWQAPLRARDEWTRSMYEHAQVWAYLGVGVLFLSSAIATVLLWRGRRWLGIVTLALGTMILIDCIEDAYEAFSHRASGLVVAEHMRPLLTPETRVYSVKHYDQTVPFYIGRTVTLVNYTDEFALGLAAEPGKSITDLQAFARDWVRPGPALAIIQPGIHEQLKAQGLPMQLVLEDPRRVLVRKP